MILNPAMMFLKLGVAAASPKKQNRSQKEAKTLRKSDQTTETKAKPASVKNKRANNQDIKNPTRKIKARKIRAVITMKGPRPLNPSVHTEKALHLATALKPAKNQPNIKTLQVVPAMIQNQVQRKAPKSHVNLPATVVQAPQQRVALSRLKGSEINQPNDRDRPKNRTLCGCPEHLLHNQNDVRPLL